MDHGLPLAEGLADLAFQHLPDATLLLEGRVIRLASARVLDVFGWHPDELIGRSVRILYPGETDFAQVGERARQAMLAYPVHQDERFMRHRNGQITWMEGRGRALDQSDPHRMSIWSYRPMDAEGAVAGLLTAAERRVARHLVNGLTSKEIGRLLGCSHRTVEVHRASMIRKAGVRNSAELVRHLLDPGG